MINPVADYKCEECGDVLERPVTNGESFISMCDKTGKNAVCKRIWSAPHLGSMSSGEPAR